MMNKENYVKQVLKYIKASRKVKLRIKDDLMAALYEESDNVSFESIVAKHGEPKEMACEFMDNLELPNEYYGVTIGLSRRAKPYEYISKAKIFGIPLVHINISGRYGIGVAKGIIAIGDVAFGLISIGGLSLGLISIGGISIGAFALGGIAAGALAIGGIAIGYTAIGGIAVATFKAIGEITRYLTVLTK